MKQFWDRYRHEIVIAVFIIVIHTVITSQLKLMVQDTAGMDEFGTMAGAAYFAGWDWSNILMYSSAYYGFGYTMLMAPALSLVSDPLVSYHLMLFYNAVLLAVSSILAYRLLIKYYGVGKPWVAVIISLAGVCFFRALMSASSVDNESMLLFLIWVQLYLLTVMFANIDNRKKVTVYTLILSFVIAYSFLVHTRAIIFTGAVVVTIIGCFCCSKKWLVNLPVFILICVAGYFGTRHIITVFQENIFLLSDINQSAAEIDNTAESIFPHLLQLPNLLNSQTLPGVLASMCGRLFSIFAVTGGLSCVGICAAIRLLFVRKEKQIDAAKMSEIKDAKVSNEMQNLKNMRVGALFLLTSFLACWALISLGALKATENFFVTGENAKWITYIRYHGILGGPLILLGLAYLYRFAKNRKKILIHSAIVFGSVTVLFLCWLGFRFAGISATQDSGEYHNYLPLAFLGQGDVMTEYTFLIVGSISAAIFMVILYMLYKNKILQAALISLILSVYMVVYIMVIVAIPASHRIYGTFDATYQAIHTAETEDSDIVNENGIYYYADFLYARSARFMMRSTPMIPINGRETDIGKIRDLDNCILVSEQEISEAHPFARVLSDFQVAKLDENEYLYVKGDKYRRAFEKSGIVFTNAGLGI